MRYLLMTCVMLLAVAAGSVASGQLDLGRLTDRFDSANVITDEQAYTVRVGDSAAQLRTKLGESDQTVNDSLGRVCHVYPRDGGTWQFCFTRGQVSSASRN